MPVRLLPILVAAVTLAGCSSTTARQPVGMPFTGTWHQAPAAAATTPAGFLAIDREQILFNLDGLPRGAVAITSNETDPGLRSGRLVCADGRTLFIAVGESLAEQAAGEDRWLTPALHLDVHCFAAGAGATDAPQATLRLWPSAALAGTAIGRLAPAAPAPVAPPAGAILPADRRFSEAVAATRDAFLGTVAVQLIVARAAGLAGADLDALYRRCTVVVRGDILRELEASRLGDASALPRADRRLDDLACTDHAYDQWRSQR